jgi:hypothetical protein
MYINRLSLYSRERKCTHKRYIEARSSNHCCCGKAISIVYSECVSVALVTEHAQYHIVIGGPPGSTTFSHVISCLA